MSLNPETQAEWEAIGKSGGLWTTKPASWEPHTGGGAFDPGLPSHFTERPKSVRENRESYAVMEATRAKAAQTKQGNSFPLSDEDLALLAKWGDMEPEEIERAIMDGAEISEIEDVASLLPDAAALAEDEVEDLPVPLKPEVVGGSVSPDALEETVIPRGIKHPLGDVATPPLSLMHPLVDRWAMKWVHWEPETLFAEVKRGFDVVLPLQVKEKILALSLLLQTTSFWEDWQTFQAVAATFAGRRARFDDAQLLSMAEVDAAVRIAEKLRSEEYVAEVLAYIAGTAHKTGIVYLPPPLDQAQMILDSLTGRPELVDQVSREWAKIQNLDPTVAASGVASETPIGVQLMRLLAIRASSRELLT